MVYTFELIKHSNIRYREAVTSLSCCELLSMLNALSLECSVSVETLGNSLFLSFECRELTETELRYLSSHSSLSFMAVKKPGPLLSPVHTGYNPYLSEDLPEILKYKGKTSVPFTRMMINTAAAMTPFVFQESPLTFLDPLCGKATGCFCALTLGMNASGLDQDSKALREASAYFSRYLQFHTLKHEIRSVSETAGRNSVPVTEFIFADTREHFLAGDRHHLRLAQADTCLSSVLYRRRKAHIIAADLPYGVQHAPIGGGKPEPLRHFLERAVPVWKSVMASGGAMALSFNTLTLPASAVRDVLRSCGLQTMDTEPYLNLKHEVEQAVVRDVVFACNTEEENKS